MTNQDDKDLHIIPEQNNKSEYNKGKYWPQLLAVLAVTLGPLTGGLLMTWSSPFALVITKDIKNYNISEDEASFFIVFQPVGMIFASLFFFKMSELLGRKKALMFLAVPHITCWIIIIFAETKWHFYASRFIGGMGDAVLYCTVPPYVGEITTPQTRGFLGNLPMFLINAGSFFITVLDWSQMCGFDLPRDVAFGCISPIVILSLVAGSYFGVQTTAYICVGLPVLFALLVSMLPESPYQLIRDGKYDKARKSINWLIRKPDIEEDFLRMRADVERQMTERAEWRDLLTIGSNRCAMRAAIFLRLSQQLCGISVFAAYTQPIFEKAGGNFSPQVSSMIFIGLAWMLNLFSGITVEKVGRKLSYCFSLLSCGVILVIMSVYFILEQYQLVNLDQLNWVPLTGMILYIISYSFGLGIVPTLMLGELFSANIKSKALSLLMTLVGLMFFFTTNMFHQLTANVGFYSPFMVYGICCVLSSIVSLRWVPETKGKTLEEIQQALKK